VAQRTVSPDFFDLMSQELTAVIGHQAPMIVRKSVAALGESTEKFPKSRLAELLEILSKEIVNEPLNKFPADRIDDTQPGMCRKFRSALGKNQRTRSAPFFISMACAVDLSKRD
jgi:hypothetical protein